MRSLALETSTRSASIALLDSDEAGSVQLVQALEIPVEQRTAESLIPACRDQLCGVGWTPNDLDLICVSVGPGSFTGLRIGVVAAKTLAYAVSADVAAVSSLQVVAAQAAQSQGAANIIAVSDAQRGQLFSQSFAGSDGRYAPQGEASIVDVDAWLAQELTGCCLIGEGLGRIRERLPVGAMVADEDAWRPRAETVGRLGILAFLHGQRGDLWTLSPRYVRASAAEEKIAGKDPSNPQN